jgi:hypothetical protein
MSGDHDVGRPPISARWRVTAAVLTTVPAAAACTNRGGIQQPTTSMQTTGVPAARSNGGTLPPARNPRGLIAYSTQAGDIWVMHADGSNRRQVTKTRDPAFDFDPSLSPDWPQLPAGWAGRAAGRGAGPAAWAPGAHPQ